MTTFPPPVGLESLFLPVLQVFFILASILYAIFAFLVIRQIELMRRTVITPTSGTIRMLGYLHLILVAMVIVWYILTL